MAEPLPRERRALATAVRVLRARNAMTQAEVLDAAGLGRNYLTGLERGTSNPTFDALVHIARALDVTFTELATTYDAQLADQRAAADGGSERHRPSAR